MTTEIMGLGRFIASRFHEHLTGRISLPRSWLDVGNRRGHDIDSWWEPGGKVGEYLSAEPGTGVVYYNTAYGPIVQCHALVHEMSHAEVDNLSSGAHRGEVPGFFAGTYYRRGYDDDPSDYSHQVACAVQLICLGSILNIDDT